MTRPSAAESFDYLVVGSGSAGCAVAARLSEDPDVRVALVEAGPPAKGRLFEIPALFSQQLKTAYDWDFETEPEAHLGGRRAYLPRGRVVGGTSSMNTMLYVRGHRYDYDTWRDLGNKGWGYSDVLDFFKKSEDNQRGADEFHGVGGPLTVSDPASVHPLLDAWVEAAQESGHPLNPDFNGAEQEGVGHYQVTQRRGLRCSSAVAFLEPAAHRPNLTVLTSTLALRVMFDGNRATGLEVDRLGDVRTIRVEREIVLSLGAYNSPHLLLQSGVGPADELRAAGIAPRFDLPDVGRNMQDPAGPRARHQPGRGAPAARWVRRNGLDRGRRIPSIVRRRPSAGHPTPCGARNRAGPRSCGPAGAGHVVRAVRGPAGKSRVGHAAALQSLRQAAYRPQLFVRGGRPCALTRGSPDVDAHCPTGRAHLTAGRRPRHRGARRARARIRQRSGDRRVHPHSGVLLLPSVRELHDGKSCRQRTQGLRRGQRPRRRHIDHAHTGHREHQRARNHDWRTGSGVHPRRGLTGRRSRGHPRGLVRRSISCPRTAIWSRCCTSMSSKDRPSSVPIRSSL